MSNLNNLKAMSKLEKNYNIHNLGMPKVGEI